MLRWPAALFVLSLLLPITARADEPSCATFEGARMRILAMAGDYRVSFDMRETTAWNSGYTPIPPYRSGGHESVRVIEDDGRRIVLQHLLVVGGQGERVMVIKHWRQDWTFEPGSVLSYSGNGRWTVVNVPAGERRGRWSQTVWQTDDSPRYGVIGYWAEEAGVCAWQSHAAWRPLARRDAIRHPPYDRYWAVNRHAPSPSGWIHWQDNRKMGLADGVLAPIVQEIVLNSYVRDSGFDVAAADSYWTATRDYWAAVRAEWNRAIDRGDGVSVAEVADTGSASGARLMGFADAIREGRLSMADGVNRARDVIAEVTAGR